MGRSAIETRQAAQFDASPVEAGLLESAEPPGPETGDTPSRPDMGADLAGDAHLLKLLPLLMVPHQDGVGEKFPLLAWLAWKGARQDRFSGFEVAVDV